MEGATNSVPAAIHVVRPLASEITHRGEDEWLHGRHATSIFFVAPLVAQNTVDTLLLVDSRTRWKALAASDRCKNIGIPPVSFAVWM